MEQHGEYHQLQTWHVIYFDRPGPRSAPLHASPMRRQQSNPQNHFQQYLFSSNVFFEQIGYKLRQSYSNHSSPYFMDILICVSVSKEPFCKAVSTSSK